MFTVNYKPIVIPEQRRADGSFNVKIRVTFKRKIRKLATNLDCVAGDLTRAGKIKSPSILTACDKIIGEMRQAVAQLSPFALESMTADDVITHIRRTLANEKPFALDFVQFVRDYGKTKKGAYADYFGATADRLATYCNANTVDVNDITAAMLDGFYKWLLSQGGKGTGAYYHLARLASAFKEARRQYNDDDATRIPRDPFARVSYTLPPKDGQHSCGREIVQQIIKAETADPLERFGLDIFVVSFGLMGANVADLVDSVPPLSGTWEYRRKKTRERSPKAATMRVDVDARISPFLERLTTGAYSLAKMDARAVTRRACRGLLLWTQRNGLARFSVYAARKSFASLMREIGVNKDTIDECLAHAGNLPLADVYIERNYKLLNAENKRLLDTFDF